MSLTENSDQVFLPGGCNRTQNLRFGPYTIYFYRNSEDFISATDLYTFLYMYNINNIHSYSIGNNVKHI